MAQVMRPQRKDDQTKTLFTIAGAAAGAGGGPSGALMGAGIGSTAADIVDQRPPDQPPLQTGSDAGAMARRMKQLSEDRLATLRASESALSELPEPLRQYYSSAITQARVLEERSRS